MNKKKLHIRNFDIRGICSGLQVSDSIGITDDKSINRYDGRGISSTD